MEYMRFSAPNSSSILTNYKYDFGFSNDFNYQYDTNIYGGTTNIEYPNNTNYFISAEPTPSFLSKYDSGNSTNYMYGYNFDDQYNINNNQFNDLTSFLEYSSPQTTNNFNFQNNEYENYNDYNSNIFTNYQNYDYTNINQPEYSHYFNKGQNQNIINENNQYNAGFYFDQNNNSFQTTKYEENYKGKSHYFKSQEEAYKYIQQLYSGNNITFQIQNENFGNADNQNITNYNNIIQNEDNNINLYTTDNNINNTYTDYNIINSNLINNTTTNNANNSNAQSIINNSITNNNNKDNNVKNNSIIDNNNTINNENIMEKISNLPKNYHFFTIGLYNIGSTCYMNATLQCLLHVSPLIAYFIKLYPKDSKYLQQINDSIPSKGHISQAFFQIINSIINKKKQSSLKNSSKEINPKTSYFDRVNTLNEAVSPENFQKTLGKYNPQFKNLEANDSKDLILYLLQIMHQELNYYSKNPQMNGYPNQYNKAQTYFYFIASYERTNYSIISDLFYGTYENVTKCLKCNSIIYNFQKFEFLSFGVSKYDGKEFNIMNGFDDYTKIDKLTGDNQYYCNNCKKLCDAEIRTQLIWPPKHLLINVDYGKNKKYMPSSVKFDEEINITKYINFDFKKQIKYRILGVCSHLGDSGLSGHYIAFCKNLKNGKWYKFNDSIVSECSNHYEIMNCGTPYLLLYEQME